MFIAEKGLKRYQGNPIIKPMDVDQAIAVFNCGQTTYKGKTILVLPVQRMDTQTPCIHIAESDDGINFKIRPEPFIKQSQNPDYSFLDNWVIDPRVAYIPEDDMYYICRPMDSGWGTATMLMRTKDFETCEEMGVIALPSNRVPSLFQGKINGRYVRVDRPNIKINNGLWLSYSDDLIHWGEYKPLIKPFTNWSYYKMGPTPPIKTKEGWLMIIHGVKTAMEGTSQRYSLGAVLLDLEDPSKVIGKMMSPILTPNTPYEYNGHAPSTVFACGAIADEEKDELRVYYGAADTSIGLATGSLSEIIEMCKKGE